MISVYFFRAESAISTIGRKYTKFKFIVQAYRLILRDDCLFKLMEKYCEKVPEDSDEQTALTAE